MKRISIFLLLLLCAISCNKDNGNGSDPTSEPAEIDFDNIDPQDPHYQNKRGSAHTVSGNRTGTISGTSWCFEQWAESSGQYSMTYYDNGTFKANWSNCSDYLVRVGFKYNGIDYRTKNFIADYQYTKTGNAGYGYVGAYGWTQDPIVEFYIVDDWYGNQPSAGGYVGQKKGELTVDGATYAIYYNTRANMPTPFGNGKDFLQILSVRKSARHQGRIHISAHFGKWEELGLQLGKLTEVSLLTEAGTNAVGTIEYTYFNLMALPQ
ncbi:MAG: glycoside hydrolase family 11 protein [Bacteroidales bacterium]|nr:glycoside hydrolase family 11 protein [Bacteroidales bacterium]